MDKIAVVDIECNGLDTETVDVHCIVVHDGVKHAAFRPDQLDAGIHVLNGLIEAGYVLAGHNVIEYDIPILRRYGMMDPGQVYDTLVVSRATYPGATLYARDQSFLKKRPALRDHLKAGAHSLHAWGLRLGEQKGDYDGGWEEFSEEMLRYCIQDVAVNAKLLELLRDRMPDEAALLECDVAQVCRTMRLHGVAFDVKGAEELTIKLAARRAELHTELREAFGSWYESAGTTVPKRSQNRKHLELIDGKPVEVASTTAGVAYDRPKLVEFNPASTEHIAKRLIEKYGWVPAKFTDGGKPQVTAEVLNDLPYPEALALAEYQEIKKILGYVAEGTNAWLKLEESGRLHGKVNPTGTVSSRASHNRPNTGNVPSRTELGHQCRALFRASPSCVLVGADASGLQLRGLAHYLAKWDGGAFARQCETGDIHEYMREATGLFTRSNQKTWTYAKLFGAGPGKLGQTAIVDHRAALAEGLTTKPAPKQTAARRLGKQTLANLGNAIPAFDELEKDLEKAAKRGWLTALDGRRIPISSAHIAIAMLLQSFEACIMKKAMALAALRLEAYDAKIVLWVHDEFQMECAPEYADEVGQVAVEAMREAGEFLGCRVDIAGEYQTGTTWADTH